MDCSPPGSSVHGILQARILEWVAIPFSRRSSQPRDQTRVSCIGRWVLYQQFLSLLGEEPLCCQWQHGPGFPGTGPLKGHAGWRVCPFYSEPRGSGSAGHAAADWRPAGQGRLPRGEKPWTGAPRLQKRPALGLPAGVSLLASPLQEEQVRRKKREERLQQIRHNTKLRFAAKRMVSVVPGTTSRRRLPARLVGVSRRALGPFPGSGAA